MAFVRRTTVKGREYYQWVRSYREDGRPKHELLVHLGRHRSPEEAIAHHKERLAFYEQKVSAARREAQRIKAELLEEEANRIAGGAFGYTGMVHEEEYGVPLGHGKIPARHIAEYALEDLRASLKHLKRYRQHWWYSDRLEDAHREEELDLELGLAQKIIAYHRAAPYWPNEYRMERHRAKLEKLLDAYEKYGGAEK